MKTFKETIEVLSEEQKQLLCDTILHGSWGDAEGEFANEDGDGVVTEWSYVYVTNVMPNSNPNFKGRKRSAMFRSMYKKVETMRFSSHSGAGQIIAHCTDWWGDGSGDVMFIRRPFDEEAEQWAREYNDK